MIRNDYHLHDEEARRRMNQLYFLGDAGGRTASGNEEQPKGVEPENPEDRDAQ